MFRHKRTFLVLGFSVIGIGFFLWMQPSRTLTTEPSLSVPSIVTPPRVNDPNHVVKKDSGDLQSTIAKEAAQVGQIDEHPQETEERLNSIAANLSKEDFATLEQIVLDEKKTGDERFLSGYLLSKSNSSAVIPHQFQIARTPIVAGTPDSMRFAFEQSLRAQALEGLEHFKQDTAVKKGLKAYAEETDNTFLADRAMRVLHSLESPNADSVSKQDSDALKKVLKKIK